MSESENTGDTQAPVAPTPAAPVTAGGLLKAARQAAGVHMAVLSVNLKVPVRMRLELLAQRFGQVAHQIEIGSAPLVDPAEQLSGSKTLFAQPLTKNGQTIQIKFKKVGRHGARSRESRDAISVSKRSCQRRRKRLQRQQFQERQNRAPR